MSVCLSVFYVPDDKLSKCQWIFIELGVCIDIVENLFGIANGQILSTFELSAHHMIMVRYYHFTFLLNMELDLNIKCRLQYHSQNENKKKKKKKKVIKKLQITPVDEIGLKILILFKPTEHFKRYVIILGFLMLSRVRKKLNRIHFKIISYFFFSENRFWHSCSLSA